MKPMFKRVILCCIISIGIGGAVALLSATPKIFENKPKQTRLVHRGPIKTEEQKKCLKEPNGNCIYKYLTEIALRKNPGSSTSSRIANFYKLSNSLISIGELEIAEMFALRGLAETSTIYNYPNQDYTSGLIILGRIEKLKGNDARANILFSASSVGAKAYIYAKELSQDNNEAFIMHALKKKNGYLQKFNDSFRAERSAFYIGHNIYNILNVIEELADSYGDVNQFQEAKQLIHQINPDYIISLIKNGQSLPRRYKKFNKSNSLIGPKTFDIDSPEKTLKVLRNNLGKMPVDNVISFLDVLFEIALKKYEQGDEEYSKKIIALAEKIIIKENFLKRSSKREYYMLKFYALNRSDDNFFKVFMQLREDHRRNIINTILRVYLVKKEFNKAVPIIETAQSSVSTIKLYSALFESLYKNKKYKEIKHLLERLSSKAVNYPIDQKAEVKKEMAKYFYLFGESKRAKELVNEALNVLNSPEAKSFYCVSGSYCPQFSPKKELLGLLVKYEKTEEVDRFLKVANDYSSMALISAKNGNISFALKSLEKSKTLYNKEVEDIQKYYTGLAEKNADLKKGLKQRIADRQRTVRKEKDGIYLRIASEVAFYISTSPDREKYKDDFFILSNAFKRDLGIGTFLPVSEMGRTNLRSQISDYFMLGRKIDIPYLFLGRRLSEKGGDCRDPSASTSLFESVGLKRFKEDIWSTCTELIGRKYDRHGHVSIKHLALDLIKNNRIDDAEKMLIPIINNVNRFLKTGYKANFVDRKDRAILRLVSSMVKVSKYEEAKELIVDISSETTKRDAYFQIAKNLLEEGEKGKAKALIEANVSSSDDSLQLVDRFIATEYIYRFGGRYNGSEMIYEMVDYLNDRIFVLDAISHMKEKKRYINFVQQVKLALYWPKRKTVISMKSIDLLKKMNQTENVRERLRGSTNILGKRRNFENLESIKNVALKQISFGYKDDATETLNKGFNKIYRSVEDRTMFYKLLYLVNGYAGLTGPIGAESKRQIINEVRTRPYVRRSQSQRKSIDTGQTKDNKENQDYYEMGLRVLKQVAPSENYSGYMLEVPPNKEGLELLLRQGKIRKFTKLDDVLLKEWRDGMKANFSKFNEGVKIDYIVTDRIMLPSNMGGSNSRNFLVLANVPNPIGPISHNNIYYLSNYTCRGPRHYGYCGR